MEEDLDSLAAKDLHELLRAWELKHRHRAAECVTQHTLFRKETRWPGYYYRGDVMRDCSASKIVVPGMSL